MRSSCFRSPRCAAGGPEKRQERGLPRAVVETRSREVRPRASAAGRVLRSGRAAGWAGVSRRSRFAIPSPLESIEMRELWGRGERFGIVPIGDGSIYCFAVANAPRGGW